MIRHTLFLVGFVLATHSCIAQTVSGLVSSPVIGSEETVAYTLEISGADASDIIPPAPPDAEGLLLLSSSASRATSMSITNGRISRSVSYTWQYMPEREGNARFLEASVMIGSEIYTAPPVSITVVAQAQRPQPQRRSPFGSFSLFDDPAPTTPEASERDIFIRAIQSSQEAYLNEQVTLDYKLYFRPGTSPRNSRQADSWDAEGFWREELELPERPVSELVVENGLRYQVVSIRRVAVFPTRPGELSIDPLKIAAEVQSPDADPFRSFFSSTYSTVERASPAVNIISKSLPENAPNGFKGAVGRYSLDAELNQTRLEVGEALQLTVTIAGTGNIALIEAPDPDFPGIFEVYDPEVNVSKAANGNLIGGRKTFTWLLIPRTNGIFQIPPIQFAFFSPSESRYVVRSAGLDPVTVTGTATGTVVATSTATGFPIDDVAVLRRGSGWVRSGQTPLHDQVWFYLILGIPLLGLGATAILRRRMTRLATDTAWARNRKAHPLARKHLRHAKKLLAEGNPDRFYAALERSILGFLGNRMNISERGLTRAQLTDLLAEAGVPGDRQQELVQFLDACDAVRFAPVPPDQSQMEGHLAQASHILSSLVQETEPAAA